MLGDSIIQSPPMATVWHSKSPNSICTDVLHSRCAILPQETQGGAAPINSEVTVQTALKS